MPGTFTDESVCGWDAASAEVFVRSNALPIRVRRVNVASAASTFVFEVNPPPVGLRGVNALVVSHAGDAYAYSYGQELSRLYAVTTDGVR